ncbi:MAG: hypothetical protein RL757_430 [Bacteroidota bacterium]|jgi:hypothetical protein
MYVAVFVAILGTTVFWAWRKSKTSTANIGAGWEQLPTDFHTFYEKFHSDSTFQMAHIRFPLAGLPNDADSSQVGNFFWQQNDWKMHRMPQDTAFVRIYSIPLNGFVNEVIKQKVPPYFGVSRRFAKMDDGWQLIYYVNANQM